MESMKRKEIEIERVGKRERKRENEREVRE